MADPTLAPTIEIQKINVLTEIAASRSNISREIEALRVHQPQGPPSIAFNPWVLLLRNPKLIAGIGGVIIGALLLSRKRRKKKQEDKKSSFSLWGFAWGIARPVVEAWLIKKISGRYLK